MERACAGRTGCAFVSAGGLGGGLFMLLPLRLLDPNSSSRCGVCWPRGPWASRHHHGWWFGCPKRLGWGVDTLWGVAAGDGGGFKAVTPIKRPTACVRAISRIRGRVYARLIRRIVGVAKSKAIGRCRHPRHHPAAAWISSLGWQECDPSGPRTWCIRRSVGVGMAADVVRRGGGPTFGFALRKVGNGFAEAVVVARRPLAALPLNRCRDASCRKQKHGLATGSKLKMMIFGNTTARWR